MAPISGPRAVSTTLATGRGANLGNTAMCSSLSISSVRVRNPRALSLVDAEHEPCTSWLDSLENHPTSNHNFEIDASRASSLPIAQ